MHLLGNEHYQGGTLGGAFDTELHANISLEDLLNGEARLLDSNCTTTVGRCVY